MGFQLEKGKIYNAPVVFGPALCPLQDKDGKRFEGVLETVDKYTVVYEVERARLEEILPAAFELLSPHMIINIEELSKVAWLAGRSYKRLEVQTPVKYKGKKGLFNMITWENNGDSIIQDRDIHGIPKVFAHITNIEHHHQAFTITATSWIFKFLDFSVDLLQKPEDEETLQSIINSSDYTGIFNYRYIPMTGEGFTKSEANYVTLIPTEEIKASQRICSGTIEWHYPQFEDMPTQYYFVQKLANMKPIKYVGAYNITFERTNDKYNQQILD
jgi:hypothetical protein